MVLMRSTMTARPSPTSTMNVVRACAMSAASMCAVGTLSSYSVWWGVARDDQAHLVAVAELDGLRHAESVAQAASPRRSSAARVMSSGVEEQRDSHWR
ncbi:hypothetical protein AB0C27_55790 [Nonomuraea sp. NPDC048882]|uniref:hypothetical protein n=1 Tax=Nonomuraea sp. NPDC048882 TaxID=3154347 RepID=UPI0033F9941F